MLKRLGLAGMLFATLAVAPLTISAQDWNNNHRSAATTHEAVRDVQSDRENRGRYVESGDRDDRGRYTRARDNDRDFRSNGEQREWNR